jgi:hypothetical protein
MRVIPRSIFHLVLCILLAAQSVGGQAPAAPSAPGHEPIQIERGSRLTLGLAEPVSSATAKKGQIVRLKLREPWVVEGHTILPAGTPAVGTVGSVQRAVPGKKNGHVVITAGSVQLPSGRSLPLDLEMPDRQDCDGAMAGCVATYTVFFIVESPLLLIELPIILAHPHELRKAFRTEPTAGVDSNLPAGCEIFAFTKHKIVLPMIDGPAEPPTHPSTELSGSGVDPTAHGLQRFEISPGGCGK